MEKINTYVQLANSLLDEAGERARGYFRKPLDITLKEGGYPVTEADKEIETHIREVLAEHFPFHDILGEEYGVTDLFSAYLWVIDPIDGTTAFAAGKPTFATLIALYKDGKPLFGMIDQPVLRERWIGMRGKTTLLNQDVCAASSVGTLGKARLNCTTPDMFSQKQLGMFQRVRKLVASVSFGGDAYAYGLLAAGHVDVILEADLKFYDVAALIPIIEGAGGVITDWNGRKITTNFDGSCLAAANAELHTKVLEVLKGER